MPFQVVYSVRVSAPGVITFFSAGEDQSVICATDVDLEAIIIGDTEGHTFWWDQISGNPIVWTTPRDGTTASYNNPTTIFDDKVFRFWIGKGTPDEQYDDINIYGTPTSKKQFGGTSNSVISSAHMGTQTAEGLTPVLILNPAFTPTPQLLSTNVTKSTTEYYMQWGYPDNLENLIQYTIEEKLTLESSWNQIAIIPSTGNTFYGPLQFDAGYRVVAHYRLQNNDIGLFASDPISTPTGKKKLINEYVDTTDYNTFNTGTNSLNSIQIPSRSVLERSRIDVTYDAGETRFEGLGTNSIDSVSIQSYSVLERSRITAEYDAGETRFEGLGTNSLDSVQITNYTVLDLTGGGIGGGG